MTNHQGVVSNITEKLIPKFIIAGAMRAGSTFIFDLLRNHPEISMPPQKELHFFSKRRNKISLKEYSKQFKDCDSTKIIGEASPEYMFFDYVLGDIKKLLPDIKLIFVLRNPVHRAYSHYWWAMKSGYKETMTFRKALAMENKRLENKNYKFQNNYSYRAKGKYYELLQPFYNQFDADQIKVIILEEFLKDQQKGFDELCDFLGISHIKSPKSDRRNHAIIPKYLVLFRALTWLRTNINWNIKGGSKTHSFLKSVLKNWPRTDSHPTMDLKVKNYLYSEFSHSNALLFNELGKENIWEK